MTASSQSTTKETEATHNPGVNEVHPDTAHTVIDQTTVVRDSTGDIDEIHYASDMENAVIQNHNIILDASVGGPRIVTAFQNARNLVINGGTVVLGGSSGLIMQTAATVTTQRARGPTGYHTYVTHMSMDRAPVPGITPHFAAHRAPGPDVARAATSGWNAVHRDAFFSHILVDSDAIDTGTESDPPPPYVTPPPYAT